jgi:hypothetical protein
MKPGSAGAAVSYLQFDDITVSIPMPFHARQALRASCQVPFKIGPLRNQAAGRPPRLLDLVEGHVEIRGNPGEGLSGNASIKHGQHPVKAMDVETLGVQPKWSSIHWTFRKDAALSPCAYVPTSSRDSTKQSVVPCHWLVPWRVGKNWEGRHRVLGEGHGWVHKHGEPIAGTNALIMFGTRCSTPEIWIKNSAMFKAGVLNLCLCYLLQFRPVTDNRADIRPVLRRSSQTLPSTSCQGD